MLIMLGAVAALAVINVLYKAAGPAVLGDRAFSPRTRTVADALPVALLAGLLVTNLLGHRWHDRDWTLLPGLAVAIVIRACHGSHLACIVAGVLCTAALRVLLHAAA